MDFKIGWLDLNDPTGFDHGPKSTEWNLEHVIEVEEIPGRGKKFKTVRTSDKYTATTGPLWICDVVIRCVTNLRYKQLVTLCEEGGPFQVVSSHKNLPMYIVSCSVSHGENDKEPTLHEYNDDGSEGPESNHATWTLKLREAHDGD
jgi:hypothetical protein